MRKKLRTHIESVEEFNPEARDAQSAELERIRRLKLQQQHVSVAGEGADKVTTLTCHMSRDLLLHRHMLEVCLRLEMQGQQKFMLAGLQRAAPAQKYCKWRWGEAVKKISWGHLASL